MSDLWQADMYADAGAGTFPPVRVVRKDDYDALEQTEAAMRRRLEEAVADCERLREKLADRIEERDDSNRNLTAALQRESKLQAWLAEAERNDCPTSTKAWPGGVRGVVPTTLERQ